MFEYNTRFTPFSLAGFRQWPHNPEETEGYILVDKDGVVDFYPAHIELYEIPKAILQVAASSGRTVRGSFHSHPTGCTSTKVLLPAALDYRPKLGAHPVRLRTGQALQARHRDKRPSLHHQISAKPLPGPLHPSHADPGDPEIKKF